VDHQVYDHTSLLATVKTLFGLPQFLTKRDAQANTLADANFLDAPRPAADMPTNLVALVPSGTAGASRPGNKLSDLQRSLLALSTVLGSSSPGSTSRPGAPGDRGQIQGA
jgi:hypothetical protein